MPKGMDGDFFFNPATTHDRLHGALGTAAIHVGRRATDTLGRARGIGEQQCGMAVFAPQGAQGPAGEVGQRDQAVFMALAATDVDLLSLRIDVADFKGQGFAQAQAHRVGGQEEDAVAQFTGGADQAFDFGEGEDVGQCLEFGGLDDFDP